MVWKSDYWWLCWLTVPLLFPPVSPASCSCWLRGCVLNWIRKAVRARFFAVLFLTWLSCLIKPSIQPREAVVVAPLNWMLWGAQALCRARKNGGSYFSWPCCQKECRSFFHLNAAQLRSAALKTREHGLPSSPFRLIMEKNSFPCSPQAEGFLSGMKKPF